MSIERDVPLQILIQLWSEFIDLARNTIEHDMTHLRLCHQAYILTKCSASLGRRPHPHPHPNAHPTPLSSPSLALFILAGDNLDPVRLYRLIHPINLKDGVLGRHRPDLVIRPIVVQVCLEDRLVLDLSRELFEHRPVKGREDLDRQLRCDVAVGDEFLQAVPEREADGGPTIELKVGRRHPVLSPIISSRSEATLHSKMNDVKGHVIR